MVDLEKLIAHKYFGSTLREWLVAAGISVAVTSGLVVARRFAQRRTRDWAAHTAGRVQGLVSALLGSLRLLFFVALGLWLASEYVTLSARSQRFLRVGMTLFSLIQIGLSLQAAVKTLSKEWTTAGANGEAKTAASATTFLASLAIWTVLVVMALSTLGFEISALVAGLGVGGVAAALAVQSILGDLLASLSIYFDRPFNLGDFIVVGQEMGTVEKIGLRTTRVRSLGGEQIVFANGDLTKSRIRNYQRMEQRRVVFTLGVEYGTTLEQLREIPVLIKSIVEAREGTRFDRAHFKEFGDYALTFEVVYYVLSSDYNAYMDRQQAINFEVFRQFGERGIQFAFPTRTLLVHSMASPGREPRVSSEPRAAKD